MSIYFFRHGESDQTILIRLLGHSYIPLNEYGRRLAQETGQALANVGFDAVFSSPLGRARETAEIIVGDRKCPFYTDSRLQEIGFGEYEGLCYGVEHFNIPDADFLSFFNAPERYATPPRGEGFQDIIARTGEFWAEITGNPAYADSRLLVSTHGCALKALLANIRRTPLKDFWSGGLHRNCAVTIVEVKDGRAEVTEEGKIFYEGKPERG